METTGVLNNKNGDKYQRYFFLAKILEIRISIKVMIIKIKINNTHTVIQLSDTE